MRSGWTSINAGWRTGPATLAISGRPWRIGIRDRVWRVVMAGGRSLGYPTRVFVERWVGLLQRGEPGSVVSATSDARNLVRDREVQLKRSRARFTNPRRLELWGR